MASSSFLMDKNMGEEQHLECSIETYYSLNKPQQLAQLAFDKDKCDSFLRWGKYNQSVLMYLLRYRADRQQTKRQEKARQTALKAVLEEQLNDIVTANTSTSKTRSTNKLFRKVISSILKRDVLDDCFRKNVWLISSNTLVNIQEDPDYYQSLKAMNDYPDFHLTTIEKDVNRTAFRAEIHREMMRNVLLCYARRNPRIGYCQGMNNITHFFLQQGFSEEEVFWVLTYCLENLMPIDYYADFMLGLLCDLKIFNDLIKFYAPKLSQKFIDIGIDTSIVLTHWFVCLFTNSSHPAVLRVIWDHFFAKGTVALFKAALVYFIICEEDILASVGVDILHRMEERVRNYHDSMDFNKRMNDLYLSKKAILILRDLYRQIFHSMIDFDQQTAKRRNKQFSIKRQEIPCSSAWPICHHYLEREKLLCEPPYFDHFVLRQKSLPTIIPNHFKSPPPAPTKKATEEEEEVEELKGQHNQKENHLNIQEGIRQVDSLDLTIEQEESNSQEEAKEGNQHLPPPQQRVLASSISIQLSKQQDQTSNINNNKNNKQDIQVEENHIYNNNNNNQRQNSINVFGSIDPTQQELLRFQLGNPRGQSINLTSSSDQSLILRTEHICMNLLNDESELNHHTVQMVIMEDQKDIYAYKKPSVIRGNKQTQVARNTSQIQAGKSEVKKGGDINLNGGSVAPVGKDENEIDFEDEAEAEEEDANPLRLYILSLSNGGSLNDESQPEALQFMKQFTPIEGFSNFVLSDLSPRMQSHQQFKSEHQSKIDDANADVNLDFHLSH